MAQTLSGKTILETDKPVEAEGIPGETLMSLLLAKGIRYVVISYDGGGDSGQVEAVSAWRSREDIEKTDETVALQDALEKALENLGYDILDKYCPGDWCNNEGGFGQIHISLSEDAGVETTLEFSQRIITTEDHSISLNEEAVQGLLK